MKRFEDSPGLFGIGIGTGTYGEIRCDVCGKLYNQGCNNDDELSDDSVTWTEFAGLQVCICCFAKVENAVLRRMADIIPWYTRILQKQRDELKKNDDQLQKLVKWILGGP